MSSYEDAFRRSVEDPESFWLEAARGVDWDVAPTRALDDTQAPSYRWFPDATLNTSFNALDRHVAAGAGDRTALIWDSAMVPAKTHLHVRRTARRGRHVRRRAARSGRRGR